MERMDSPCKYCDKANIDFVNDCEYGCDNPCKKAKDFYKEILDKIDILYDRARGILRKEDEGK